MSLFSFSFDDDSSISSGSSFIFFAEIITFGVSFPFLLVVLIFFGVVSNLISFSFFKLFERDLSNFFSLFDCFSSFILFIEDVFSVFITFSLSFLDLFFNSFFGFFLFFSDISSIGFILVFSFLIVTFLGDFLMGRFFIFSIDFLIIF